MAGNIIPAIATTNAMTASLCVMQSFKVLRGDYSKARLQFLSHTPDRLIMTEPLRPPNPECPVCGTCQTIVNIDTSRATLRDMVETLLKGQLAYGDEFSVSTRVGQIWDPDMDDNLDKLLQSFDIKQDTFLTIYDDADVDPRVNLSLAVSEETLPTDQTPVNLPQTITIPRKPKQAEPEVDGHMNGLVISNGCNGAMHSMNSISSTSSTSKRKRNADEADLDIELTAKKGKVVEEAPILGQPIEDGDIEVIDDKPDGAIVID